MHTYRLYFYQDGRTAIANFFHVREHSVWTRPSWYRHF